MASPMWSVVSIAVVALSFLLLLKALAVLRDFPTRFLLLSIWLRYALSAFHQFTFDPIVAGLSINAAVSIVIVAAGLLVVQTQYFRYKTLVPVYALMACIALSGVISGEFTALLSVATKWGYFLVVAMLSIHALYRFGPDVLLKQLLTVFALPIILQLLSFILGYSKAGEIDGSLNFIGGYNHEAVFSVMVLTFLLVAMLADKSTTRLRALWVLLGVLGLLLANYRTTLLAVMPLLGAFFMLVTLAAVQHRYRGFIAIAVVCTMAFSALAIAPLMQERFADIAVAAERGGELVKAPTYYTDDEQDIFSARAYLWSQYINAHITGSNVEKLFGFGPDAWQGKIEKYAHNTFISYLYEFGILGLAALLCLMAANIRLASKVGQSSARLLLVSAHLSFVILNLATMPLWQIEGVIFYALLSAMTWYAYRESEYVPGRRQSQGRMELA